MKIVPVAIVAPFSRSATGLRLWMQPREGGDGLAGLLEFPGGKIEPGETPIEAAVREVSEEVNVRVPSGALTLFNIYTHSYPEVTVSLYAFLFEDSAEEKVFPASHWTTFDSSWRETFKGRIPEANFRILEDLEKHFL